MVAPRHFESFSEARSKLRSVLDAARDGMVTTVTRDDQRFVVVAADALAQDLRRLVPSRAVVVAEGGGWAAYLPGVPVHGDANTFDAAIDDLIDGLREYAEDWNGHLRTTPNHAENRTLVELVELSDDGQLRDWLVGRNDSKNVNRPVPA